MTSINVQNTTTSLVNVGLIAHADQEIFDKIDDKSVKNLANQTSGEEFAIIINCLVNASCGVASDKPDIRLGDNFGQTLRLLLTLTQQSQLGIVEMLVYARRTMKGWR